MGVFSHACTYFFGKTQTPPSDYQKDISDNKIGFALADILEDDIVIYAENVMNFIADDDDDMINIEEVIIFANDYIISQKVSFVLVNDDHF